jgi:mannose-1-phosphate guanylyltransferase
MSNWAAVLAGGSGTRFWPLSTPTRPKQMLHLSGDQSLLVSTVKRLDGLIPPERILIITSQSLAAETRRLLPSLPAENVLAEPRAASTAPALAWATVVAASRDPSASVLSLHADWHVGDDALFRETAAQALGIAEQQDMLVTIGVVPTRPDPGYGYIQPGEQLEDGANKVAKFIEKPDVERARELIDAGALWNSGMFAWTAARFLAETEANAPEIAPHLDTLKANDIETFFERVTPVAIDVSHFERSTRVACIPGRYPWDDVGTWAALGRVRTADETNNVLIGMTFQRDASGCLAWAEDGAVVIDGVSNLVVVQANGVTLVTTKDRCAALKELLDELPSEIRSLPR